MRLLVGCGPTGIAAAGYVAEERHLQVRLQMLDIGICEHRQEIYSFSMELRRQGMTTW